MTFKLQQVSDYCPFARLASSDCLFLGNRGCRLMPLNMESPRIVTDAESTAQLLALQAEGLSKRSGVEIRGPFNRLLTVPVLATGQTIPKYQARGLEIVMNSTIEVSTPSFPKELSAILGASIAVIGTHRETGLGTFNVLLQLLPTGHLKHTVESTCAGRDCCSLQFTRWIEHEHERNTRYRKDVYLASLLNIFRGGLWNMTMVASQMEARDVGFEIDHANVHKYLTTALGYDGNALSLEPGRKVIVAPDGTIDVKPSVH